MALDSGEETEPVEDEDQTPRPMKKIQPSGCDSEDNDLGPDEVFQTPNTLKKIKVMKRLLFDSELSEVSESAESAESELEDKAKGKGKSKSKIKSLPIDPRTLEESEESEGNKKKAKSKGKEVGQTSRPSTIFTKVSLCR